MTYTLLYYGLPTEETLTHRGCRCIGHFLSPVLIGRGSIFVHAGDMQTALHSALSNLHAIKPSSVFTYESPLSLLDMCYHVLFGFDTESYHQIINSFDLDLCSVLDLSRPTTPGRII